MIDLKAFVDSLGPLSISKDDAAVAIAAVQAHAIVEERERCAAIVQLAREGEIDSDLRSIISRIEGGKPAKVEARSR